MGATANNEYVQRPKYKKAYGQDLELGKTKGTFKLSSRGGALSKLPSRFHSGSFVEKYVLDSIGSPITKHFHETVVVSYGSRQLGSTCLLLNGVESLSAGTVTHGTIAVEGGTGAGARVKVHATFRASFNPQIVFTAPGTASLGKAQPMTALCHGI